MRTFLARAGIAVVASLPLIIVAGAGADASGPVARASLSSVAGAQLWVSRYNGPGNGADQANAVGVSPDGKVAFVTGYSTGTTGVDYATIAYGTATGNRLWIQRYDGPSHYIDEANAFAISPDGKTVFVTGYSYSVGEVVAGYATIAYSAATGQRLWLASYVGPLQGTGVDATSIAVSPDGQNVFVTGWTYGSGTYADYATVAYSAAGGHQLWVSRYGGAAVNSVDKASSVTVSPDGKTVFVTGESAGSTVAYATVAYSAATGQKLWVSRYNGPVGNSAATSIAVGASGTTVFVTGYSYAAISTSGADYATIAYSAASGRTLWVSRYNGPAHADDRANAVGVSPDGATVYVTGRSDTSAAATAYDYSTVAYDATSGHQRWVSSYAGPGTNNVATSLTVNHSTGSLYVTGYSYNKATAGDDYATIAYDPASGHQIWASRYDGPLHQGDQALSVAVSPATGTVFVTGRSGSGGTVPDYATVAYHG